jgi:hypothetical protein
MASYAAQPLSITIIADTLRPYMMRATSRADLLLVLRIIASPDARDPEFSKKLKAELPGIVAWTIDSDGDALSGQM